MFKNILKQLRDKKDITQEELASIIGVERSSVGKYESSGTIPSIEVLLKLADFFGVSVDYLLGRPDPPSPYFALNRDLDTLSPEELETIKSLVKSLSSKKS